VQRVKEEASPIPSGAYEPVPRPAGQGELAQFGSNSAQVHPSPHTVSVTTIIQ
jgi:hypothetical protein